ncbi:hypothetical protein PhCBS80983_g02592 [Powellomyces hirtus]|uniref:Uncharacterized protein n=1 Tax=Powellomyces hirtus TaxID=109895 RepID=A0A507E846_9FUNG|nr:hypothetical protein PhCBS80983_g02592 [Powellomyces hirtus]
MSEAPTGNQQALEYEPSGGQTEDTVKLEALGPMVVNEDGTLSRITNWESMGEAERANVIRVIGKRNAKRLEKLKAQAADEPLR